VIDFEGTIILRLSKNNLSIYKSSTIPRSRIFGYHDIYNNNKQLPPIETKVKTNTQKQSKKSNK